MILTKLKEYADTQMNLPPEMYGETKIRWLINLKPDGTLDGNFTPLGGDTKANKQGNLYVVPQVIRSSGIKPKLLADNGEYVLGIARPNSKLDRVAEAHRQFVELVQKCADATQEPSVQAVAQFLASWHPNQAQLPADFDPSDTVTFRVGGIIPADAGAGLKSVQRFWANHTAGDNSEPEERPVMTCLVTGQTGPVEERLPVKIKDIPGGQTAGTSLVSANAAPFTSYGLKNSLTSPICRDAGERFAKALNHLIATESSRLYVGPIVYVFWTREKIEYDFWNYVKQPQPEEVKELYKSALTGKQVYSLQENQFYALALSASGGRAVVRDWLETTVPAAIANLRRWFEAQEIVNEYGEPGKPLGIYSLAASAYRDAKKEMTAAVPIELVKAALRGGRLPDDLLARAVRRNRAEHNVTYPRAALIKLILTTQGVLMTNAHNTQNLNPELKDERDRTAYHCGRLLAELEAVQRTALGKVNASLTDRYYGSASSTPASVFASLLRGARAHLAKLRKNSPGTCNALEERLEEVISQIPDFPRTLTMHHQGLFALGYYHQRAADRAAAKAAKAAKNQPEDN